MVSSCACASVFVARPSVVRARVSRHARQRQRRYRVLKALRVSSLKLISAHQQLFDAAPQVNDWPQASHTEAPSHTFELKLGSCRRFIALTLYLDFGGRRKL